MRKNIGLYINFNVNLSMNVSSILDGNPGIGGTEYTTLVLAFLLAKNGYCVYLYSASTIEGLPVEVNNIISSDIKQALNHFDKNIKGFFVCLPLIDNCVIDSLNNTYIIIWWHINNYSRKILTAAKNKRVVANVFLTNEQCKSYFFDLRLIRNAIIIGHFVPGDSKKYSRSLVADNVAFLGNPSFQTSFDKLIEVWPRVVKKNKKAHLFVCGSASLYHTRFNVGEHGLLEKEIEEKVFKTIKVHKVSQSITFLGTINQQDKNLLFRSIKVGVVNPLPRGKYETFCLSALDFASFSIPAIGGNFGGTVNTIPSNCGIRVKSKRQLYKAITKLLNDDSLNISLGNNYKKFVTTNYSINIFENKWLRLFSNCLSGSKTPSVIDKRLFFYYFCKAYIMHCNLIIKKATKRICLKFINYFIKR